MGILSRVKTWAAAETLTAADLNAEFNNILNNLDPDSVEDASANATAMQATADPYPGASASLATDLRGEVQRLRYVIKQITGESQWYIDPDQTTVILAKPKAVDFLPIGWAIDGASAPAPKSTLTSTYSVDIRNFDAASDEDVYIPWQVPFDLTGSTVTFRVICFVTNATGPSTEGVAFFLQGVSLGDGELLSATHGTAVKSSFADETHAQYDRVTTDMSGAVTITNLAAGETAILKLYRDVSDADDDYAQDIGVAGIEIKYSRLVTAT